MLFLVEDFKPDAALVFGVDVIDHLCLMSSYKVYQFAFRCYLIIVVVTLFWPFYMLEPQFEFYFHMINGLLTLVKSYIKVAYIVIWRSTSTSLRKCCGTSV